MRRSCSIQRQGFRGTDTPPNADIVNVSFVSLKIKGDLPFGAPLSAERFDFNHLTFNRDTHHAAPLGPGTVINPDIAEPQ